MYRLPQYIAGFSLMAGLSATAAYSANLPFNMDFAGQALMAQANGHIVTVQQQVREAVQLRLINATGAPVDLYVVNQQTNQPEYFGALAAGETSDYRSWAGLVWIFGQNQQPFMNYQTNQPKFQEVFVAPQNQQRSARFLNDYQPDPVPQGQASLPQGQGQTPLAPPQPLQPAQPQTAQPLVPNHTGVAVPEDLYAIPGDVKGLAEPEGFWTSTITLSFCRKARYRPGNIADICKYLGHLKTRNPAKFEAYMAGVQARIGGGNETIVSNNGGSPVEPPRKRIDQYLAQSWGGVVRAGPSMDDQRIDSLGESEEITLLQESGVWMNDYQWFQIRYRDGQIGYQWGGIICGVNGEIPGAHRVCDGS